MKRDLDSLWLPEVIERAAHAEHAGWLWIQVLQNQDAQKAGET